MPPLDPAVIALIGTICGTIGMTIVQHILGRSKAKTDRVSEQVAQDAANVRQDKNDTIIAQRGEIKELEAAVDKWRDDYYDLRDEFAEFKFKSAEEISEVRRKLDEAVHRLSLLDKGSTT